MGSVGAIAIIGGLLLIYWGMSGWSSIQQMIAPKP